MKVNDGMVPQKTRRAQFERDFKAAKAQVRTRSGGMCEYPGDDCQRAATQCHHKLPRQHPRANDPDFLLDLCTHHHHEVIHKYPEESYRQGWLLRWEDVPA